MANYNLKGKKGVLDMKKKITKNELMEKLLVDGDVLEAGICRSDVCVVLIPKQSKANDKRMRIRSGILYGNTKFTDEQIIYFYNKHKGNASAASGELRMNRGSYKQRLSSLGLKPKPLKRFTDKQIIDAYKKCKGNFSACTRELKMSKQGFKQRAAVLGLVSRGLLGSGVGGFEKHYSDKEIIAAMKKAKNNSVVAASLLGCHYKTVQRRIKQLKIEAKGIGGKKKK